MLPVANCVNSRLLGFMVTFRRGAAIVGRSIAIGQSVRKKFRNQEFCTALGSQWRQLIGSAKIRCKEPQNIPATQLHRRSLNVRFTSTADVAFDCSLLL